MTRTKFLPLRLEKLSVLVGVDVFLKHLNIPPRFRSAVIDQLGMILILIIVCSPLFVYTVYQTVQDGSPPSNQGDLWVLLYASFGYSIYINKDVFMGRSIGKRVCGLQIIDRKTNEAATPIKCMIRNITFLVWPFEIIILLVTKNRRIGDFIANTEIVQYNQAIKEKFSLLPVVSSVAIGTVLFFMIFQLEILRV